MTYTEIVYRKDDNGNEIKDDYGAIAAKLVWPYLRERLDGIRCEHQIHGHSTKVLIMATDDKPEFEIVDSCCPEYYQRLKDLLDKF
jgi:hypothetical protein